MARRGGSTGTDTMPGATTRSLAPRDGNDAGGGKTEAAPRVRLNVLEGADAGATLEARRPRVLVATHPACDLVLTDAAVSRFHLAIGPAAEGRLVLRDLDSRNGTRLDGVPVLAAPLASGAVIAVGETRLRFGVADEPLAVPVAMTGCCPAWTCCHALAW